MAAIDELRELLTAIRDASTRALDLLGQLPQFTPPAQPAATDALDPGTVSRPVAWGAKVSQVFVERIWWCAVTLGIDPDWLMACIAWESGETFSPNVKNMAGSGATGLIQFMPTTAKGLGTTTAELAAMTAEDQINYVYKYFRPWAGKLNSLADTYMAILLPNMVGKPDNAVLFSGGTAYRQNAGLDNNLDGNVTKLEATAKVAAKLTKGKLPENIGLGA